ncbi:MAG TPA: M23 family metallopeptidase [Edaphobacter sp.]|nr:M23 family metallopeptidase [Edaphobacter sp.]
MSLKKRYYIMFVSRDEDGGLNKVPVPLHYAYIFVAAAVIGMFTITGMAGSYSRMLIKTAHFNQLRQDHSSLQKDYAHLEKTAHDKDVEAASLGSLASEVSALYGLTTSKLTSAGKMTVKAAGKAGRHGKSSGAEAVATTQLADANVGLTDESYYKSLQAFYALRNSAMSGAVTRSLSGGSDYGSAVILGGIADGGNLQMASYAPSLWPVMGPITSSFGEREDPVKGNGEGEFHKGLDISAPNGTPVHVTADGVVKLVGFVNGYGREVIVDHGHGVESCYAHMSAFSAIVGQTVIRGQVIGYVGHSGRVTGPNLHYEVRIRNTPVNPHRYMRLTMATLDKDAAAGS